MMHEELMGSGGVCCQAQGLPRAQQACLQLIITMCANALGAPGTKYIWKQALGIPHATALFLKGRGENYTNVFVKFGSPPKPHSNTCTPMHKKITSVAFASSLSRLLFGCDGLEATLKPESHEALRRWGASLCAETRSRQ